MLVSTQAALDDIRSHLSADVRADMEQLALHSAAALTRSRVPIDLPALSKAIAGAMPTLTAVECDALALYVAFVLVARADTHTRKPVGSHAGDIGEMATDNVKLLQVQMAMQRENQVFTSVSNVLKTRHDTVKNSISNIR